MLVQLQSLSSRSLARTISHPSTENPPHRLCRHHDLKDGNRLGPQEAWGEDRCPLALSRAQFAFPTPKAGCSYPQRKTTVWMEHKKTTTKEGLVETEKERALYLMPAGPQHPLPLTFSCTSCCPKSSHKSIPFLCHSLVPTLIYDRHHHRALGCPISNFKHDVTI